MRIQALMTIDTDLSELRDRFFRPAEGALNIPMEVQLASIERTLSRLKDQMVNAKVEDSGIRSNSWISRV